MELCGSQGREIPEPALPNKRPHHRPALTVYVEADRIRLLPDVQNTLGGCRAGRDDKGSARAAAQPCLQMTYSSVS